MSQVRRRVPFLGPWLVAVTYQLLSLSLQYIQRISQVRYTQRRHRKRAFPSPQRTAWMTLKACGEPVISAYSVLEQPQLNCHHRYSLGTAEDPNLLTYNFLQGSHPRTSGFPKQSLLAPIIVSSSGSGNDHSLGLDAFVDLLSSLIPL